jgi:hypothetical protein
MQALQVASNFFPGVTFSGTAMFIYIEMAAFDPSSVRNLTSEDAVGKRDPSSLVKRATISAQPPEVPCFGH